MPGNLYLQTQNQPGAEKQGCDHLPKNGNGEHAVIKVLPEVGKQFKKTFQVPQEGFLTESEIESADALPAPFDYTIMHIHMIGEHGKYNYVQCLAYVPVSTSCLLVL